MISKRDAIVACRLLLVRCLLFAIVFAAGCKFKALMEGMNW